MIIVRKNILSFNDTSYTCAIGKNGITSRKKEGDGCTPLGEYSLGTIYFRKDKVVLPKLDLPKMVIDKNTGWCDDVNSKRYYNKLIKVKKNLRHEKLFRKDYKYDFLIPINYNTKNTKIGGGSAIFIHLTKKYNPTAGCIALQKKDFLILLKLINKDTKIRIT